MRINEVYRNNEYRGRNSDIEAVDKDDIKFQKKKLKGMYVGIYRRFGGGISAGLYDPQDVEGKKRVIKPYVEIYLTRVEKFWATTHTVAHTSIRGTGLGFQLYLYMLKELRIPLVCGDTQTVGGRTMWFKLWQHSQKDPKLSVYGWYPDKSDKKFVALQPSEEHPGELEPEDDSRIYRSYWDESNDEIKNLYDEYEYFDDMKDDILSKYDFDWYSREYKQEVKPIKDKLAKLKAQIKKLEYKQNRDAQYADSARILAIYDPKSKPNTEII